MLKRRVERQEILVRALLLFCEKQLLPIVFLYSVSIFLTEKFNVVWFIVEERDLGDYLLAYLLCFNRMNIF